MWEIVHTEERNGFTVKLEFGPEHDDPRGHFDTDDCDEICDDITSGNLLWFVARVAVQREGITLGDDYLGGCCYASAADFMAGGYYEDMIHCAMVNAESMLERLTESRA